jgi:hypothetical protein
MSAEALRAPIRSPSRAAERMRQYRKRHRKGLRCVRIRAIAEGKMRCYRRHTNDRKYRQAAGALEPLICPIARLIA